MTDDQDRVLVLLQDLRWVMGQPDRWCRGAGARRADGTPCDPHDPAARSWGVMGALEKALFDRHFVSVSPLYTSIPAWPLVTEAAVILYLAMTGHMPRNRGEAVVSVDARCDRLKNPPQSDTRAEGGAPGKSAHERLVEIIDNAIARRAEPAWFTEEAIRQRVEETAAQ